MVEVDSTALFWILGVGVTLFGVIFVWVFQLHNRLAEASSRLETLRPIEELMKKVGSNGAAHLEKAIEILKEGNDGPNR